MRHAVGACWEDARERVKRTGGHRVRRSAVRVRCRTGTVPSVWTSRWDGTSAGRQTTAMPSDAPITPTSHALAAALGAALVASLDGRLRDLHWFRTDWQRGGAATGQGRWCESGDGPDAPGRSIIVKVPVNLREYRWLERTARRSDGPVAELIASGLSVGPYDFAWVIIERLPHGPLGLSWHADHLVRICDAAARFHRIAAETPLEGSPRDEDWDRLLSSARDAVREPTFPERNRWSAALKEFSKRADRAVDRWRARQPLGWIHGDLHPANAMSRVAVDHGPACLIDLAEVRVGHWVEDAVYLERLHWPRPERLAVKPLRSLADARKREGLETGDYAPLAAIRRVLLAATAPAFKGEHSPVFLGACLARLEEGLREVR